MKKLITLSTLTAGIGVSAFGLNIHHADAAELTQNQATQQVNQQKQNQNVIHYNEAKSKKIVTNKQAPSHFTNTIYSNNHTNPNLHLASHTTEDVASATSTMNKLNSVSHTTSSSSSSTSNSSSVTSTSTKTTSSTKNNFYTAGQCTWYVYDKVNGAIGSTWGNANNWANAAASAGYTVNNRPSAGAIMQSTAGAYGHVAYVESVNSNGSITVSEMNYGHGVGVVTSRTLSSSEAASYNFIH